MVRSTRIIQCTKCGGVKASLADFCRNPHCEWGKDHAPLYLSREDIRRYALDVSYPPGMSAAEFRKLISALAVRGLDHLPPYGDKHA